MRAGPAQARRPLAHRARRRRRRPEARRPPPAPARPPPRAAPPRFSVPEAADTAGPGAGEGGPGPRATCPAPPPPPAPAGRGLGGGLPAGDGARPGDPSGPGGGGVSRSAGVGFGGRGAPRGLPPESLLLPPKVPPPTRGAVAGAGAPSAGCSSRGPRPAPAAPRRWGGGQPPSPWPGCRPLGPPFPFWAPRAPFPATPRAHTLHYPPTRAPAPPTPVSALPSCPSSVAEVGSARPTATDIKRGKCRWDLQLRLQQANLRLYIAKWPLAGEGTPPLRGWCRRTQRAKASCLVPGKKDTETRTVPNHVGRGGP